MNLSQLPQHILVDIAELLSNSDLSSLSQCARFCRDFTSQTRYKRQLEWTRNQFQAWSLHRFNPNLGGQWDYNPTDLHQLTQWCIEKIRSYTTFAWTTLPKTPVVIDDSVFPYPVTPSVASFKLELRRHILPGYFSLPDGPCPDQSTTIALSYYKMSPIVENSTNLHLRLEMMTHHGRIEHTTGNEDLLILKWPFEGCECTIYEKIFDQSSTHWWHVCYEGPTNTIVNLMAKYLAHFG